MNPAGKPWEVFPETFPVFSTPHAPCESCWKSVKLPVRPVNPGVAVFFSTQLSTGCGKVFSGAVEKPDTLRRRQVSDICLFNQISENNPLYFRRYDILHN